MYYLYCMKKEGVYEPLSGPTEPIRELSIRAMAGKMLADKNLIELQVKYSNIVRAIEAQTKMYGKDAEIVIVSITPEHYAEMEMELEQTIQLMEKSFAQVQMAIGMVPGIDAGAIESQFLKACSFAGTKVLAEYETRDGKILVPVTQEEANVIREEYREAHGYYDEDDECDYDDCDDYDDECGCDDDDVYCDYDCENCPCRQCTDDCHTCNYCFEEDDEEDEIDDDEVFERTSQTTKKSLPESCHGCWYYNETIGRCMHPGMRTEQDKSNCPFRVLKKK